MMPGPLSFMVALSNAAYLHRPADYPFAANTKEPSPKLVLLLGWVAARDGHLVKYVQEYQRLYPTAGMLLVKTKVAVTASAHVARRTVTTAIPVIREILSEPTELQPQKKPQLLIHLFSNGGSCLLSTLYDVYAEKSPKQPATEPSAHATRQALPLHVTIFDSTLSLQYSHSKIVASVMAGIPCGVVQLLFYPVIQLASFLWLVRIHILRVRDEMAHWAASHNDESKVREERRVYIYSNADKMVAFGDVQEHARRAAEAGFSTSLEHFSGSPHVAHAKSDGNRYWRIVREAWSGNAGELSPRI